MAYDSTQTATVVARSRAMTSFPDRIPDRRILYRILLRVISATNVPEMLPLARTVAPALPRLVKSFLPSNLKLSSSIHPVSHSVSMDYVYTKCKPVQQYISSARKETRCIFNTSIRREVHGNILNTDDCLLYS